ncbi:MAG: NYN domain-containing protein [Planctomycetota bacterium]|nr:NYN domain-containing protein [Planctomycetota bacterium]
MSLIVDGWNVLHISGVLPPPIAGIDICGLVDLIAISRWARTPLIVVCDGAPPRGVAGMWKHVPGQLPEPISYGHATLHFSGGKASADAHISELVNRSSTPRKFIVVTSDHAVQRQAKSRGCRIIDSETFLAQLAHDWRIPPVSKFPGKPTGPLSETQVQEWLDEFGISDEPKRP